jgi:hypothetical protein
MNEWGYAKIEIKKRKEKGGFPRNTIATASNIRWNTTINILDINHRPVFY